MSPKYQAVNEEQMAITALLREYRVLERAQIFRWLGDSRRKAAEKTIRMMRDKNLLWVYKRYLLLNRMDWQHFDPKRVKAFWVLLAQDAIAQHCRSQYPTEIVFLREDHAGEIIYAALGEEYLLNAAFAQRPAEGVHRYIIVEEPDQIPALAIDGAVYYCTVDDDGTITKYIKT